MNQKEEIQKEIQDAIKKVKEFDKRVKSRPGPMIAAKELVIGSVLEAWLVMKPKPNVPINETFAQTIKREKYTEEDLKAAYTNYIVKAVLSFVFALVCLGSSFYVFTHKGISINSLTTLVFVVYTVLLGLVSMHKAYQIKTKTYMKFKEYFQKGQYI